MQAAKPSKLNANINITPLVDVVLVLLIIFMVIAPQLAQGPEVLLPTTDKPQSKPDDGRQLLVAIEHGGTIWIENDRMTAEHFTANLEKAAEKRSDWQVVIKGDARLTFGEVKQAMFAVENAGFKDVGLIAEEREAESEG